MNYISDFVKYHKTEKNADHSITEPNVIVFTTNSLKPKRKATKPHIWEAGATAPMHFSLKTDLRFTDELMFSQSTQRLIVSELILSLKMSSNYRK